MSPVHFEKFRKEAKQTQLEPFVCHKQFENDDVKTFDITQVEGYWKQEILRYMHTVIPSKVHVSSQQSVNELKVEEIAHASDMDVVKQTLPQYLAEGSQEVLSQDSGIRGCWFRALIIKKHKDKVKVRYQDIQDAADEANKLEEWILASKISAPDQLGVRLSG
ncbi:putative Agenet-like domain-containing protein [Rosa chinensis]|uniref:Putative Agenet-like domain-containing protein n=1 Tax=Rosa chinensis TaxID=74649 RepID=A0A2P6REA0_ROSCH|nr:putative Agenet-like domain-containing protein [Rosa chinensis]